MKDPRVSESGSLSSTKHVMWSVQPSGSLEDDGLPLKVLKDFPTCFLWYSSTLVLWVLSGFLLFPLHSSPLGPSAFDDIHPISYLFLDKRTGVSCIWSAVEQERTQTKVPEFYACARGVVEFESMTVRCGRLKARRNQSLWWWESEPISAKDCVALPKQGRWFCAGRQDRWLFLALQVRDLF